MHPDDTAEASAHEYEYDEQEPGEDAKPPRVRRRGRGTAALLGLFGFALIGTGFAFTFAPEFSWRVTKVARQVTELGFGSEAFVLGGLVFLGLGVAVRALASAAQQPAPEPSGDSDLMLVAEQLATDLGRMGSSLMQVQGEVAALSEAQGSLARSFAQQANTGAGDHQNSIFGLAASVDKLSARVDERFVAFDRELAARLQGLEGLAGEVRALAQAWQAHAAAASAPSPAPAAPSPAAPVEEPSAAASFVEPSPAIDFDASPAESVAMTSDEPSPTSVEEPASALPADVPDPSQEVFEAFEGLEEGNALEDLLPDDAIKRALGDS